MRIIAGEFRHRILISPPSRITRPITDRAKQSLFDALTVAIDSAGGTVLDCFCGTGSMGLECLSRGAGRAIFVERDRAALKGLRNNIDTLGVVSRSQVLSIDAYRLVREGGQLPPDWGKLCLAFVDPPYVHLQDPHTRPLVDALVTGLAEQALDSRGLIILRHTATTDLGTMALSRRIVRRLQYGAMAITWLQGGVAA